MDTWTLIRFLHLLAMALFVGGQLVLVAAIVPAARRQPDSTLMPSVARRFGVVSLIALAVLVATGIAMAGHFGRWADGTLQLKLTLLVVVGLLLALHALRPKAHALAAGVLLGSLTMAWLGVHLAHG